MHKLILKILPYILICLIFIYDHNYPYKDLMPMAICILFPMIYIFQGILNLRSKKQVIIEFSLSSIAILLFFKEWYKIDGEVYLILLYILIGSIPLIIYKGVNVIKKILN